jgi:polyphosphate kinase 2 (PPK2 family)
VRVERLVPEAIWRERYEQINQFEKILVDTGTVVLKFFLHISKEEQKERFQARLDDPHKHWKFSAQDLEKRKLWDDYMEAYEEMLNRCTTQEAAWHVIPSDQKWYRNLAVTRTIVDTLKSLNLRFPPPEDDIDKITIT